jgi:ATP-dependent Clp protease ATP-binding subunit ClpA
LKDGRLNAENGEIVDFTDSIFFFCANAESKKTMGFEAATIKGASRLSENLAKSCVHSVEFDALTPEELLAFTSSRVEELRGKLRDNGLTLEVLGAKMAAKTLDEALKLCESEIPRKVQEALSSGETTITV